MVKARPTRFLLAFAALSQLLLSAATAQQQGNLRGWADPLDPALAATVSAPVRRVLRPWARS